MILVGSTLDLDSLEVRAVTLPATARPDSGAAHDSLETFMMVKEGKLWVTLNGVSRALGAGSVALALPGDRIDHVEHRGRRRRRTTCSPIARERRWT